MKYIVNLCALTLFTLLFSNAVALAKRGDKEKTRSEYFGIIQERPKEGKIGQWVIGSYPFLADPGTEFDETKGELLVGTCAKVKEREGRVHEIESEPMRPCR